MARILGDWLARHRLGDESGSVNSGLWIQLGRALLNESIQDCFESGAIGAEVRLQLAQTHAFGMSLEIRENLVVERCAR